jgi:hypothetical protein
VEKTVPSQFVHNLVPLGRSGGKHDVVNREDHRQHLIMVAPRAANSLFSERFC